MSNDEQRALHLLELYVELIKGDDMTTSCEQLLYDKYLYFLEKLQQETKQERDNDKLMYELSRYRNFFNELRGLIAGSPNNFVYKEVLENIIELYDLGGINNE